jgi:hypothetical protein
VNIGPPETVPVEPDLLQCEYDGYCPVCHVPLFGSFWVKRHHATAERKPTEYDEREVLPTCAS